jgi:hypothetical protein
MSDLVREQADTFWARIYIAGDIHQAKQVCREECYQQGLCVTVQPTSYIYTGGEEAGVIIGLINYPRFPSSSAEIIEQAVRLGCSLMERLCQRSFSLMTPDQTIRYFKSIPADAP